MGRLLGTLLAAALVAASAEPAVAGGARPARPPHAGGLAVRGIVQSVSASSLVITSTGSRHTRLSFALTAATLHAGRPAVGAPVSVRYYRADGRLVATAVAADAARRAGPGRGAR